MSKFVKAARHVLHQRMIKRGFKVLPGRIPFEINDLTLALSAGGISGLLSYFGTEDKEQKLRNALIAALTGGGLTFGANKLLNSASKE